MKEFIKALFVNATERIKNPLIGTFLISWIVFNWKGILILLFSVNDIETKLTILADKYDNLGNLILYPLLAALGYIFLLPYINLGIDYLLYHSNNKQSERIQKNKLIAIDSQITIALKNIDLETKQQEYREVKMHNKTIDALNDNIFELEKSISNEKKKFENDITSLNEVNINLTNIIKHYSNQFTQIKFLIGKIHSSLKTFKLEEQIELISMNNIEGDIKMIWKLLDTNEKHEDINFVNRIGNDIEKAVILENAIKEGFSNSIDNAIGKYTEHE